MSRIDVLAINRIFDAVDLKKDNADVSDKTLKKLQQCAARLYGVGNCNMRKPSFRGLYAGRGDVGIAQVTVNEMARGAAQSKLRGVLISISDRIERLVAQQEADLDPARSDAVGVSIKTAARLLLNGHSRTTIPPRYDAPPGYVEAEQDTDADCVTRL